MTALPLEARRSSNSGGFGVPLSWRRSAPASSREATSAEAWRLRGCWRLCSTRPGGPSPEVRRPWPRLWPPSGPEGPSGPTGPSPPAASAAVAAVGGGPREAGAAAGGFVSPASQATRPPTTPPRASAPAAAACPPPPGPGRRAPGPAAWSTVREAISSRGYVTEMHLSRLGSATVARTESLDSATGARRATSTFVALATGPLPSKTAARARTPQLPRPRPRPRPPAAAAALGTRGSA
mmetsp:Transcript_119235/g.380077  ORF Transcript_119235/g.380077 Transcript_119235/m.380077 type:complete len:238 (-) Transcript_119235:3106-3819(-)